MSPPSKPKVPSGKGLCLIYHSIFITYHSAWYIKFYKIKKKEICWMWNEYWLLQGSSSSEMLDQSLPAVISIYSQVPPVRVRSFPFRLPRTLYPNYLFMNLPSMLGYLKYRKLVWSPMTMAQWVGFEWINEGGLALRSAWYFTCAEWYASSHFSHLMLNYLS